MAKARISFIPHSMEWNAVFFKMSVYISERVPFRSTFHFMERGMFKNGF
jgi:hypothetical protein